MAKFGYDGTPYSKEWSEAFKQGKERADGHETKYLKNNDIINKDNKWYNVGHSREHFPSLTVTAAGEAGGSNKQFYEDWKLSAGRQILPDGSVVNRCGATQNDYAGSKTGTCAMTSDSIEGGNHSVRRRGNGDNKDYAAAGAPMHSGSSYCEDGNDCHNFNGGKKLTVSARSKNGGIVGSGSHGFSTDCGGKADYGHGSSVHNGEEWQSVVCQMGDGSVYIAVGQVQAASAPKGLYTLKIDKQGNMEIKTAGTIKMESAGEQTFKAPKITMDTPEVIQTGKLTTKIEHNVPFCHSCADKAHGVC